MLNIRFIKGKYTKDLAETLQEPPIRNAHRVEQIDSFINVGGLGFFTVAMIIVGMFISAKWRMNVIGIHMENDLVFAIEFAIVFAFMQFFILPIVHEFFHALVYPRHMEKRIYISNAHTYCEAKMSKRRTILMLLLPFFVLCVLPFATLMLLMPLLPGRETGVILISILYSVFSCLLDFGASWVITFFVPAKVKVFVYGESLYWEE